MSKEQKNKPNLKPYFRVDLLMYVVMIVFIIGLLTYNGCTSK